MDFLEDERFDVADGLGVVAGELPRGDVLKVGEAVTFKILDVDPKTGKMKLSRRAITEKPDGKMPTDEENDARANRGGGGGDRGGRDDRRGGGGRDDRRGDDRRGGGGGRDGGGRR